MTDRETVISELELAVSLAWNSDEGQCEIMDSDDALTVAHAILDALELLEDEPEPKHTQWVHEPDRTNHWHCSGCGYVTGLSGLMGNFCPNCGAKVQKKTEAELRREVSGYAPDRC